MKNPKVKITKYRVKMITWVDVWAQDEDEAIDKAYDEDPSDYDWDADGDVKETDESYEDDIIPDFEREDF